MVNVLVSLECLHVVSFISNKFLQNDFSFKSWMLNCNNIRHWILVKQIRNRVKELQNYFKITSIVSRLCVYLWNLSHMLFYVEISQELINDLTKLDRSWTINYFLEVTEVGSVFEAFINDAISNLLVLNIGICFNNH